MSFKTNLLATAAVTLASGLAATTASAERTCTAAAPCVVRVATVAPPNTPWERQMANLKERVESASNGRLRVNIFPGATDGENSLARQCKDGSLEAVGVSTGAIATLAPALSVFELPFLFDSPEQADRIIDNNLMPLIEQNLAAAGFKLYIMSENGYRNFATASGQAIETPGDLAGIQMRAQESWIHEEMYRLLGGSATSIPVTEVSSALSTGRVQGFDNTPLFSIAAGWYNFVDTWTVSNHIYQPAVVVYGKTWFDSLPADLQQVLLGSAESETRSGRRLIRAVGPQLLGLLRSANINVVELTPAQRAVFETATAPIYDQFRSRVPSGVQLLDIILANK